MREWWRYLEHVKFSSGKFSSRTHAFIWRRLCWDLFRILIHRYQSGGIFSSLWDMIVTVKSCELTVATLGLPWNAQRHSLSIRNSTSKCSYYHASTDQTLVLFLHRWCNLIHDIPAMSCWFEQDHFIPAMRGRCKSKLPLNLFPLCCLNDLWALCTWQKYVCGNIEQ